MNDAKRDALLERAVRALETIAAALGAKSDGPKAEMASTEHRAETLDPLAVHVARLADGFEVLNRTNAELARVRREMMEQRRVEHLAILRELRGGTDADSA